MGSWRRFLMKYIIIITCQLYLGFPFFSALFYWNELIWVLLENLFPLPKVKWWMSSPSPHDHFFPQILKAAGFKNAVTRFQVLDTNKTTCALLQLEPLTGLKQQIRVHVAEGLKCPILGDHKFSSDAREPQVNQLRVWQKC